MATRTRIPRKTLILTVAILLLAGKAEASVMSALQSNPDTIVVGLIVLSAAVPAGLWWASRRATVKGSQLRTKAAGKAVATNLQISTLVEEKRRLTESIAAQNKRIELIEEERDVLKQKHFRALARISALEKKAGGN